VIITYGTGFTIALIVDEKFLDVKSHSPMLAGTSPSHFLCNPTFDVISTTERLFSKPQTGGGNDFFGNFSLANLLASISRDVVLTKRCEKESKKLTF